MLGNGLGPWRLWFIFYNLNTQLLNKNHISVSALSSKMNTRKRLLRHVEGLNCKRPMPKCRLFFKIDLLTDIAALCITDYIDWRYIHSLVGIFDPACELLTPWTKELYFCNVAPLSSLWPPPPLPKLNVLFIQTVCVRVGGGGLIVLCRPYSAGILHSVSDQMQNLPNYFTTSNKMTSENDIKGLVSLKFLRPCFDIKGCGANNGARAHGNSLRQWRCG